MARQSTSLSCGHVIMLLGMLTCGAAVPRADVVCRPDPTILWKVKGSGCARVPWQMDVFRQQLASGIPPIMLPFVFGTMALFQTETRGQITTRLGPHSPHYSHKIHVASTSVATARTPDEAVWCAAPQPQPALVIYNRLAKCGSSTVLSLLLRASRLSGYSFKSGDVMHELLNEREQGKLVVQLMNVSATRRVLFEQHIPYLSFPSVAAFAAFVSGLSQLISKS